MSMSRAMTTTQGLLALIAANGGCIEQRIKMQKEAYILKWLEHPWFRPIRFKYHYYGPYSRYLSACLHNAVADGLIVEEAEEWEGGHKRYAYRLGQLPDEEAPQSLGTSYAALVGRMKEASWRTLELSATVLFLGAEDGLDAEDAMQRALDLKPACRPYQGEASELLDSLWQQKLSTVTGC